MVVSVIVPTRNRPNELSVLLRALQNQTSNPSLIVVIDSSDDSASERLISGNFPNVSFFRSRIASAAVQRNIGLEIVSKSRPHIVVFLDDDVIPEKHYLSDLVESFNDPSVVGASGVAVSLSSRSELLVKNAFREIFKKLFLLASSKEGRLLPSGVPIPVRSDSNILLEVEWLIGCSAWRFESIKDLRFENDFEGYSLGEDVIFSYRASKLGKLVVDSRIKLPHSESKINRPREFIYWRKWMNYRWRLCKLSPGREWRVAAYYWSSLGQLAMNIMKLITLKRGSLGSILGIFLGFLDTLGLKRAS